MKSNSDLINNNAQNVLAYTQPEKLLKDTVEEIAISRLATGKLKVPEGAADERQPVPFRDTGQTETKDQTFVDLFEEHAAKHPLHTAVIFEDKKLTYKELDERSNRLANYLRGHFKVAREQCVGIMLDRTEKAIVALLGVLKAGAACVPIDTDFPSSRKAYIIEDTKIGILITQSDQLHDLQYDGDVFLADTELEKPGNLTGHHKVPVNANDLAYVMYTSGSTGKPKGVMIGHQSVADLAVWQKEYFKLDQTKRVSQLSSLSFDGSVGEYVMALANGCSLVILKNDDVLNLIELINHHCIDVVVSGPSVLRKINPEGLNGYPVIVSVGEKCPVDLYNKWRSHCHFINGYGPTEYTVYSHVWHGNAPMASNIPIGSSRANLITYIADTSMHLCTEGKTGEIYLSGPGIARGYLNNRKKTFENFLPNFFYLRTLYKEAGKIAGCGCKAELEEIGPVVERLNSEIVAERSVDQIIFEIDNQFAGAICEQARRMILENTDDDEFKKAFLRYYYEGLFGTYKANSLSWSEFLKLFGKKPSAAIKGADFGCGSGEFLQNIYKHGIGDITGIDINPYFIKNLVSKNIRGVVSRIDSPTDVFLKQTGLGRESLDFAVSTLTLDRVQHPANLLSNMAAVLKEGGRFILGTLLPVVEFEDGKNRSGFAYTRYENKLTPGISENEDKFYLLEALISRGIDEIELYKVNTRVRSKNGIQDYELNVFCGSKRSKASASLHHTKMYKTGDSGRWLPDDNIEFTGRLDDQIKVRGHRIEPGEIESVLQTHPQIEASVVLAKPNRHGENELIAYVTGKAPLNVSDIRQFLSQSLPSGMLPDHYVRLESFPLNPSAKIDKPALPDPTTHGPDAMEALREPATATEKTLLSIWSSILGLAEAEISTTDNFFHLGGHSLKAIQLKFQIANIFGVNLSVKSIFEKPTIQALSVLIDLQPGAAPHPGAAAENSPNSSNEAAQVLLPENPGASTPPGKTAQSTVVPGQALIPLSPAEKRLWFLYQFQHNKSIYNITKAFLVSGKLDIAALEMAFTGVVNRHESLRKIFLKIEGEPWASVKTKADFSLRKVSLPHGSGQPDGSWEEIRKLVDEELAKPFTLSTELPVRASYVAISGEEFVLMVSFHHIVADGWSMNIFFKELDEFYKSYSLNKFPPHSLAQLPLLKEQYRSYAALQSQQLKSDYLKELASYWKTQLEGKTDRLKLPYDFTGVDRNNYEGSSESLMLPADLVCRLRGLSQRHHATLFMTFFAGFQSLLRIYTGQEHISTAIPVAGRQHLSANDLIGFFVNTLLIPTSFSHDPAFDEVLSNVRKTIPEAYHHQDLPFGMLANELRNETGLDGTQLIQVMFAFQDVPDYAQLGSLEVKSIAASTKSARFDLTITVSVAGSEQYLLSAEYKTSRFKASTIKRMLKYFRLLLEQVSVDARLKISRINLLGGAEKEIILKKWNDTSRPIPQVSVPELFEKQVALTPDLPAVCYNDTVALTYRQLNEKANQLAHFLLRYKTGFEEQVGVYMPESDEAIVAILAVLKAGCAYIPFDPAYPKNRMALMLNDTTIKVIITTSRYRDQLQEVSPHKLAFVLTDLQQAAISAENKHNTGTVTRPEQLAYVMYTSGSTGNPKKVGVEHHSIIRLVKNTNYASLENNSRLLKTGSFSFDASTWEIWGMLLNGGNLFLFPGRDLLDPQFLKMKIAQHGITCLWLTTSWFNQLAEIDASLFCPLQVLMVGGERLSASHINKVRKACPELKMLNGYGPTENTTFSTYFEITGTQPESIPIGKPIANSSVYIVNQHLQLLPVGVEGEICVGGIGVARGYLNDEKLTGEKFIPDPFRPGGRLYRTGDKGKWLEDGTIFFTGREDNQIKIRGHRVEVSEIENTLNTHPGVEKNVVLLREPADGIKSLVAFYTGFPSTAAELRSHISNKLPEYMIPSQFFHLAQFPLTRNGKIDKAKLLEYVSCNLQQNQSYRRPLNDVEAKLAGVWEEILGERSPHITDNFFHLGGNSLLAVKLMSRIEKMFNPGEKIPVSVLFEKPTIRELAGFINNNTGSSSCLVKIQPNGHKPPLFLIPGYLFYYNLSKHLGQDQPMFGFEPLPGKSTKETAAHYIKLMQKIQPIGPYFIGGYCAGGIVAYEMAQQLTAAGHDIGMLALFETYTSEGLLPKMSYRYINQKVKHFKSSLATCTFYDALKGTRKQLGRALNYMVYSLKNAVSSGYAIQPYQKKLILFNAMEGMVGSANDPLMGWSKYCQRKDIEVFKVPGNHDTMFKEPHVKALAQLLAEQIERR